MVHEVEIFGQTYSLRADADAEHVKRVAVLLDQRMREVASSGRTVSTVQIAVLAALDIASEFLQIRDDARSLAREIETRSDSMARRIDNLFPEVRVEEEEIPLLCS